MSAVDVLHRVSLVADLSDEELQALAACLGKRTYARDMLLFHKSSPSQALYLIESGRVRAFALSDEGQEITLDIFGPGECFGETALVDGRLRSASAMTLEPTVTYTLERDEFLCWLAYQLCSSIMGVLRGPASNLRQARGRSYLRSSQFAPGCRPESLDNGTASKGGCAEWHGRLQG